MQIKQNDILELHQNRYYSLYKTFQQNISFISSLLHNAFDCLNENEILDLIKSLSPTGTHFNHIGISQDHKKNLMYINEEMIMCSDLPFTEEEEKLNNLFLHHTRLDLCEKNLIPHAVLSQSNLMHLVIKYNALKNKNIPYILLYQDNHDWYDLLAFQTEKTMKQFVADHQGQE